MDWIWYIVVAFAILFLALVIGGIINMNRFAKTMEINEADKSLLDMSKSDRRIRKMPEFLGGPK